MVKKKFDFKIRIEKPSNLKKTVVKKKLPSKSKWTIQKTSYMPENNGTTQESMWNNRLKLMLENVVGT